MYKLKDLSSDLSSEIYPENWSELQRIERVMLHRSIWNCEEKEETKFKIKSLLCWKSN